MQVVILMFPIKDALSICLQEEGREKGGDRMNDEKGQNEELVLSYTYECVVEKFMIS